MEIENLLLLFIFIFNSMIIVFFDKIKLFKINIDNPDGKRKLHKNPTPLAGGTIIFINLIIYFTILLKFSDLFNSEIIFENYRSLTLFFITSFLIFGLGFMDDRFNFPASIKFILLCGIILFILFFDSSLTIKLIKFSFLHKEFHLAQFSIFFSCFCFLVFLNAFNMFDGINLQSSSYSIIIILSILSFYSNFLLAKIILISILGYSFLNYKNKSFLGDSGSLLISFIIGYFFIKLYNYGKIDFTDEVVIYMLVPGIDLIRLFFKRILLKKNPLKSDRFHLHHLLLYKYTFFKSLIILLCLVIMPILMNYLNFEKLFIILFFILIYSLLLIHLTYNKSR